MRENWKKTKLGEVCFIRRGSSPRPIKDYLIKEGGMPWVKIGDATDTNGKYINYTAEQIRMEGVAKSVIVNPGDLILSNSGTAGLPMFMGITACIHDGWQTFRDLKGIDKEYLYYFLLYIRHILLHNAYDSVMKNLTLDMLRDYELLLPPIEEQKRIVSILQTIDDKIELNNKINENLEEQIFTLYHQKFVDTENKNRTKCRADEYFDISIGKTPPRKETQWFSTDPDDVTWVSISDMGSCGMYITESSEQLTLEAVHKHNIKVVPDNTVLLSFKLTVGRVAITNGEMATNEAIAHFKTDNKNINEYLYCYLKRFNYQTMGSTSSIATAVNSKIIKGMPFIIPTDDEINDFHDIVEPLFDKIKFNQAEIASLTRIRDSLLPKLMSGEIDVSDISV